MNRLFSLLHPSPEPLPRPRIVLALLLALGLTAGIPAGAQSTPPAMPGDSTLDAAMREQTIQQISDLLNARYVFPDVAAKCAEHLQAQLKSGAYDQIATAFPFADTLTRDLQSISHDKHLRVRVRPPHDPADDASLAADHEPTPEQRRAMREAMLRQGRSINFGFEKVDRLQGNVGYLDLRMFWDADSGGETAIAAMNLLANSDAIIIDLRYNGGGSPNMIQLISSYFFDEPTLLNTMYWREGDRTDQFWTLPHVPGRRMSNIPLFVLTSGNTFSGAEEFAYNMKNLKRATILGEVTGGGAHPGGDVPVNDLFNMFIPVGRAINPISKTNWEGTGVEPDIALPAKDALTAAHIKAIETLLAKTGDEEAKARLEWARSGLEASLKPTMLDAQAMANLAGTYGERRVWVENEQLLYQRNGMPPRKLVPLGNGLFTLEGTTFFRVKFEADANGKVTRLIGMYDDGRVEPMDRSGE